MSRYLGRGQVGICQRSGKKVKRKDLVEDGQVKGLLVDKNWWGPYHPQLLPPPMRADGIPHFKPAPDDRLSPPAPVLTATPGVMTILTGSNAGDEYGYNAPGYGYEVVNGVVTNAVLPFGTVVRVVFEEGSDYLSIAIDGGASGAPAQNAWTSVTITTVTGPSYTTTKLSSSPTTFSQSGSVSTWYYHGVGAIPNSTPGYLWDVAFAPGGTLLTWTQTSNDIAFTNYYVVSSFNPTTGTYTPLATVYAPDTYSIDAAGSFLLNPFPFPVLVSVPSGTILVVQAHNQEGGLSAYSNQVTA